MAWDSELEPLATLVAGCADAAYAAAGPVAVHRLVVGVPVELRASAAGGGVDLAAAPPRQALPTSVMPVLARLSLTVEVGP